MNEIPVNTSAPISDMGSADTLSTYAVASFPERRHIYAAAAAALASMSFDPEPVKPYRRGARIGRNEPCYCKSGRKFKLCHGRST